MRLGILGGTFDPPHIGHLILAEQARQQLDLDLVKLIPAGEPWRKSARPVSLAAQRLEMARLAVLGNPFLAVDEREVLREGPTYTVDTLRQLQEGLGPADEIFFLLGEDALSDMPHWREPEAIASLARLVIAPREGGLDAGQAQPALPIAFRLRMPYIGISSTWLRELAGQGHSLRYLVPEEVAGYITTERLYQS